MLVRRNQSTQFSFGRFRDSSVERAQLNAEDARNGRRHDVIWKKSVRRDSAICVDEFSFEVPDGHQFGSWSSPAQRTGVKLRPHQETERHPVATSEPVVFHHGREGGGDGHDDAPPSASTACWAALSAVRSKGSACLLRSGSVGW
jgi:hypothetical protein